MLKGDKEEEYTFTEERRNTVINYVVENRDVRDKIYKEFRSKERGGIGLSLVGNDYEESGPRERKRKSVEEVGDHGGTRSVARIRRREDRR